MSNTITKPDVFPYFESITGKYNRSSELWEYNALVKIKARYSVNQKFYAEQSFEYRLTTYDNSVEKVIEDFVENVSNDKDFVRILSLNLGIAVVDNPIIHFQLSSGLQRFDHIINAKCYESTNM